MFWNLADQVHLNLRHISLGIFDRDQLYCNERKFKGILMLQMTILVGL